MLLSLVVVGAVKPHAHSIALRAAEKRKNAQEPSFLLLETDQLTDECCFAAFCVRSTYRAAFDGIVDKWHALR